MIRAERVLLFGAFGMLLVTALLAHGAAAGGSDLRAHADVGSAGWITLAVLAVASRLARGDGAPPGAWASRLAWLTVAATTALLIAGATSSATAQAWTGAATLAAIVAFAWLLAITRRRASAPWTVARLAMAASLCVLVAGSALGVLAAAATAAGSTAAASLRLSHSAVLAVPFVVLAATSVLEWSVLEGPVLERSGLDGPGDDGRGQQPPTTAGLVQLGLLLLAAVALVAGLLAGNIALVEANVPVELGGIAVFLVRVGPALLVPGWARGSRVWLVAAAIALAADAGLVAHVVLEVGARRYVTATMVPPWLPFVIDHVTFLGVGTAALLGGIAVMTGRADRWPWADAAAALGMAAGIIATAVGIGTGSAVLERLSGTVLAVSVFGAVALASAGDRAITPRRPA